MNNDEDKQEEIINNLINEEESFVKRLVELYNSMDVVDFPFFISRLAGSYDTKLSDRYWSS